MTIHIVGGGLAGVEAAWQLARAGLPCVLSEMKPARFSPAHKSPGLAELVCSNSFKAERNASAAGLLKEEMRRLGSLCLEVAARTRVPAGGALAVDRDLFSREITRLIKNEPLIELRTGEEIREIPRGGIAIIAAGPLCSDAFSESIQNICGEGLRFYDAAAPMITKESVDMRHAFAASRYERGGEDDYLNCPMSKEEYEAFEQALITAERAHIHDFDVYEGCMPIEVLAARGKDAIRYGPMKPVGLRDPATGKRPWAVLQLRRENAEGNLFNLVGFQTNLKFKEQSRVFGMIPALRNAEFVRYGVMHRNTFIDSPRLLDASFRMKENPRLWFAGQITGVEGYMESAGSGLLVGLHVAREMNGLAPLTLPGTTMLGALSRYISDAAVKKFQPMGASFGLLPPLEGRVRDKRERYEKLAERALRDLTAAYIFTGN